MSSFCPTIVSNWFSSFFGWPKINSGTESLMNDDIVAYEDQTMKVIVPPCPLAAGAVKIIPSSNTANFTEWQDKSKVESYRLLQRVAQVWAKKGITDYLIYGKESNNPKSIFSWEIVPYPKEGWRFWKQFKVLWNITFGGAYLSKVEQNRIAQDFQTYRGVWENPSTQAVASIEGKDAFCNQAVINKQRVFEGKEINVLYNYAPIGLGKEKLHFLIVPKKHHSRFTDLTETEYLETMQLSQKLINFYKDKGYHTAYLFDKTGAEAGQTVPHWHEHIVFTATKTQDFFGKLTVLKNMLITSSPLPQKELQTRVESLTVELSEVLKGIYK